MQIPVHFCDIKNFGDQLNRELFNNWSIGEVDPSSPKEAEITGIGSILEDLLVRKEGFAESNGKPVRIFGSGFGHEKGEYFHDKTIQYPEKFIRPIKCYALRGKLTQARVESITGAKLKNITLGDPGLLANELLGSHKNIKEFSLGIVPHFGDKDSILIHQLAEKIKNSVILDISQSPKKFLEDISKCDAVVSTALHPLIACDSLGIPNMWIRVSETTTTRYKFNDYYSVFNLSKSPLLLTNESIKGFNVKSVKEAYDIPSDKVREIQKKLKISLSKMREDMLYDTGVDGFQKTDVVEKSVLIVEPNPYHGEIIPGYVKYFKELGYSVDVLLRKELIDEKVFHYVPKGMLPNIFYGSAKQIAYSLASKKVADYDLVFFSSNVFWEGGVSHSSYIKYLGRIPSGRFGSLYVEHNLASLHENDAEILYDDHRVFSLLPYATKHKVPLSPMVNPHYFGNIPLSKKKSRTEILIAGSTNHDPKVLRRIFRAFRTFDGANIHATITGGNVNIPKDLEGRITSVGRVDFSKYYKLVQGSDYLLTLFNPSNKEHRRYLHGTTSGTVQLSLGFKKPMIIEEEHASNYGFDSSNAVLIKDEFNSDFLKSLNFTPRSHYASLVSEIEKKAKGVYDESQENLRSSLALLVGRSPHITKVIDDSVLAIAQQRAEIIQKEARNRYLETKVSEQYSELANRELELKSYQLEIDNLTSMIQSKRYRAANRIATAIATALPKGTVRRRAIAIPVKFAHRVAYIPLNSRASVKSMQNRTRTMNSNQISRGLRNKSNNVITRSGASLRVLGWRRAKGDFSKINTSQREAYVEYGKSLVKRSGLFDENYYLKHNPDVLASGVNPLDHFIRHGGQELRNPSSLFDSAYYVNVSGLSGTTEVNPLLHHLSTYRQKREKLTKYNISAGESYRNLFKKKMLSDIKALKRVVVMETMAWDGALKQRPHHVARLLAEKGVSVVYIDPQAPRISSVPRKAGENLYLINDLDIVDNISSIEGVTRYYWLFSTSPTPYSRVERIVSKNYRLIYDYIDDFDEAISGDITEQLHNYRNLNLLKPSISLASAVNLRKQLVDKLQSKNVLLCQNAVDMNHFVHDKHIKESLPDDLVNIVNEGKPIVGYYGAMAPWLDYELINTLTKKRKDLNFIFIGVDYNGGLANLELNDNVYFLGPKNYHDLPHYSSWFDCALIPFRNGDIAKSTSPVKLFEYMAMALPTVCTKDLNECRGYEYVYISKDHAEYEANIDKAIAARRSDEANTALLSQATQNTWEARVDTVYNEMDRLDSKAGIL